MKRIGKALTVILAAAVLCLCTTGCLSTTADELYRLPRTSERNTRIQAKIEELLDSGLEFSAPVSGFNRQSIQQYDLDGDGNQEVIAFFRTEEEKPLEIDVMKEQEGSYVVVSQIFGEGRAVDSVAYSDMDGDGTAELLVGWQMSPSVKVLNIYSMKDFQATAIAEASYFTYVSCDLNETGGDELLLLREPGTENAGEAVLYTLMEDGEVITSSAAMSIQAESIGRVQSGGTADSHAAVYVDSLCEGGLITDVFAVRDGVLYNLTTADGGENDTVRPYTVYCSDIDRDGVMEIPRPVPVYAQSETPYYTICWTTRTVRGFKMDKLFTYHNYSDGWYLVLPEEIAERITIRRVDSISGERAVVLSILSGPDSDPTITDILAVYTLTGENKAERAVMNGRFLLVDDETKLFAASILNGGEGVITEEQIRGFFSLIRTRWLTGSY